MKQRPADIPTICCSETPHNISLGISFLNSANVSGERSNPIKITFFFFLLTYKLFLNFFFHTLYNSFFNFLIKNLSILDLWCQYGLFSVNLTPLPLTV